MLNPSPIQTLVCQLEGHDNKVEQELLGERQAQQDALEAREEREKDLKTRLDTLENQLAESGGLVNKLTAEREKLVEKVSSTSIQEWKR